MFKRREGRVFKYWHWAWKGQNRYWFLARKFKINLAHFTRNIIKWDLLINFQTQYLVYIKMNSSWIRSSSGGGQVSYELTFHWQSVLTGYVRASLSLWCVSNVFAPQGSRKSSHKKWHRRRPYTFIDKANQSKSFVPPLLVGKQNGLILWSSYHVFLLTVWQHLGDYLWNALYHCT